MTDISRRSFGKFLAGAGAAVAVSKMGQFAAYAGTVSEFRATVAIFLYGGSDSWNMIVPLDQRYQGYASARGAALAIPQSSLVPLTGTAFGLHPAMAALKPVWDAGGMAAVLNTGTLYAPINRQLYLDRPELRPTNLMSHSDEQAHWQGLRARDTAVDGFLGRLNDRMDVAAIPPLMSFTNADLALLGQQRASLVLPLSGVLTRNGANKGSVTNAPGAREAAMAAFAAPTDKNYLFAQTTESINEAYSLADPVSAAVNNAPGGTDAYFVDPATGSLLSSNIAKQLMRVARMIASRAALGHGRQAFFASQGGYDTHAGQTSGTAIAGTHASLLKDLALALAGFYKAMGALNLQRNVTAFTMSDFGRTLRGNASRGSDHGWGGNHLVVGGPLKPQTIHGLYPSTQLGGVDDADTAGRIIPTISQEEYIGAIMRWHGVSDADLPYVLPNWATWSQGGRGPVPLFT